MFLFECLPTGILKCEEWDEQQGSHSNLLFFVRFQLIVHSLLSTILLLSDRQPKPIDFFFQSRKKEEREK